MRLAMLCGPYHGMRQVRPEASASLVEGVPFDHPFAAKKGQCFRVFATASAGLALLTAEALDPDGTSMARSDAGPWVVAPLNGVFCADKDGSYRVRLTALQGKGDVALQVWLLP